MANKAYPDLPADQDIRRILILKWGAMGDVVIASSAFEDIRNAFPGREIHLNTTPPWDNLFRADPRFSKLITINPRSKQHRWKNILQWLRDIRRGNYDLIIDLQSNDRSRLLMILLWLTGAGVAYRMGHHRRFPYNVAPDPTLIRRTGYDYLRTTLESGGISPVTNRPVLYCGQENIAAVHQLFAAQSVTPHDYVVFVPGSSPTNTLKRWGAIRYIALANALHDQGVRHILLLGGADEMEECRAIETACGSHVVNLCGKTQLLDIVPILQDAVVAVCNDTGLAHIASVADTPTVIICGPTDVDRVRPAGRHIHMLQADIFCKGCYRKTCAHHSCMMLVSPEMVMDTLHPYLADRTTRPDSASATTVSGERNG